MRCEEIPARMLSPAIRELAGRLFEELMACGLGPREVETGYTPRRLVVRLSGLPEREPDREEEKLGPPVSAAFGPGGEPTRALLGFAERCGVAPESVRRVRTERGEYVAAVERHTGRPAAAVLASVVPTVLDGLAWPKTMRWDHDAGPWVRPVHGLVALLAGEVVPFSLFGVEAGRETAGHPILSPQPFRVEGGADYREELARRGIEVRVEERRRRLGEQMAALAAGAGGRPVEDPPLLERLAAVCEIPGAVLGRFDARFLKLPREVLTACLRDHQSAFTVEAEAGLLPCFLTVMDRPDDPADRVRLGNEWVVAARLADARFFYEEDRKVPLAERREGLEQLTFHGRLGSYAEKGRRVVELADLLCRELGWEEEVEAARLAGSLLKCDLTTALVKEFTSLQGVLGGVYAREEAYAEPVWQAIYDQYLPAAADDPLPRGRVGKLTALADRLDTLVGVFGLGLVPTGSKDPFGLRRAALGVVRIALEGELPVDLDLLAAKAARLYGDRLAASPDAILATLRPFLQDRVRFLLGSRGYAYDEIEAALGAGGSQLPDLAARVAALHRVREEPDFLAVVLAAKRIANILRGQPEADFDPALLAEDAERELHAAAQELLVEVTEVTEVAEVEEAARAGEYERGLRRIAGFARVLDRFFVEVLVMDEDPALRRNRLALLQAIQRILSRTARLTEMVVEKG